MSLTQFTTDISYISALPDSPTPNGGYTKAQLKSEFDKSGNALKTFLNEIMIAEIEAALNEKASALDFYNKNDLYSTTDGASGSDKIGATAIEGLNGTTVQTILESVGGLLKDIAFNVKSFGAKGDGVTDDSLAIQSAIDTLVNGGLLFIPNGTYYIGTPIDIKYNNITIIGGNDTFLKCKTKHYSYDSENNKYYVGQENVLNATGLSGITIKNITLIGSYDTSWGNISPYSATIPAQQGSALLFLYNCKNIYFENFVVQNSFGSFVTIPTTWEDRMTQMYGHNPVKLSFCENVTIDRCKWEKSCGEAWLLYRNKGIQVTDSEFIVDYCTSMLDVVYSEGVLINKNRFVRNLDTQSGELVNVPSSNMIISNNIITNGNVDFGNEFLNTSIPFGQSFVISNIVISNNIVLNGSFRDNTANNTFNLTYCVENIKITNNIITIDLDLNPNYISITNTPGSAFGITAIGFNPYKNIRKIEILGNTINIKGNLNGNGTNRWQVINLGGNSSINPQIEDVTIANNVIKSYVTGYDVTAATNPFSVGNGNTNGTILFAYGNYTNINIFNNIVDTIYGLRFMQVVSLTSCNIKNNDFKSQVFALFDVCQILSNINISNNKFNAKTVTGYGYKTLQLSADGFCSFIYINLSYSGTSATINLSGMNVNGNEVDAPTFMYGSNVGTNTSVIMDNVRVINNMYNFVEVSVDAGVTLYPVRFGRGDGGAHYSSMQFIDNTFTSTSGTAFNFQLWAFKKLDMLRNLFIGNFTISFTTDSMAAITDSRFIMKGNIANSSSFSQSNISTFVNKNMIGNSDSFYINVIPTVLLTDEVYYDRAAGQLKVHDGSVWRTVAVV